MRPGIRLQTTTQTVAQKAARNIQSKDCSNDMLLMQKEQKQEGGNGSVEMHAPLHKSRATKRKDPQMVFAQLYLFSCKNTIHIPHYATFFSRYETYPQFRLSIQPTRHPSEARNRKI